MVRNLAGFDSSGSGHVRKAGATVELYVPSLSPTVHRARGTVYGGAMQWGGFRRLNLAQDYTSIN